MRFSFLRYTSALIVILGLTAGIGKHSFGQVSSMNFTQTTGTYTEITGGTVVATASGTTGAASLDDVIYTLGTGTIPFNFTFDNVAYTDLKISTNGFLTFGSTAPSASGTTTGYTPISASTAYAGAVSPMARNLNAYFFSGVPAQTGEIRYQTLGTSPNRTFVVQWKNFKTFNTGGTTFGPVLNFQVRLFEGSNAIEMIYNCSGAFASSTAQVGLRGPNNLFPTNINNRSVAASTNTWITSVAGTANTSTCEFSGSLLPPAGLTYRFSPNQCPSPQNTLATNITQTTAELTWTTTGGGGTFTVEYGLSGFTPGTGQVLNGVQSGVNISGLNANTAYQFYVTQNCGSLGNSPRVGPVNFSTGTVGEDCATAILVNVANSLATCSFTTVTSGVSANGPNAICSDFAGNNPNDDRWYRFVAPSDGSQLVITSTAGTNSDWVMEVWSACPNSAGIVLKCADDVNVGMPEIRMCQNEYNAGQTYYIRMWTYSNFATGTANLCVYKTLECPIPPVNDECISAIVLPVNIPLSCPGLSQTFTTLYATPNTDAATCDNGTKRDVWFSFNTANHPGFKLTISPLTATTLKAQVLFECGGFELNCYSPANGSYTFSGLNPSADYVIRVWSDTGTAGTFTICLESTGCPAPTASWGASPTICSGQSASVPVNFTGTAPWTFSYRNNTTNQVFNVTTSANPYNLSLSPTTTTSYTLVSVSDANCAGTASGTATVTVTTSLPAPVLTGPLTVCRGATGQVYSTTAQTGVTYSWTVPSGVTIASGQGTSSITTTWGSASVSGNVTLSVSSSCGSNSGSLAVVVSSAPTTPSVTGSAAVCRGQSGLTYSVASQAGATYTWTVPSGVTIVSGQGSNSITTTWSSSAVSGNVSCQLSNSCGTVTGSIAVTVNSAPSTPAVVGTTSLCTGQTGVGYSVTAQTGVTYSWTVPTGATVTAGQGTNAITTSWSTSSVSGNVTCVLTNSCGSVTGTLSVAVGSSPSTPSITGNASVCPNQAGVVYSTTAQTGVTYSWTVPAGVTITSGQGTNSITTTWGASAVSGNVALTVTNTCGGANATQAVSVSSTPAAPVVSGPASVCRNATGQVYSTTAQSGVTYTWTVPAGVTITAGQGTNSITTTWGSTSVSGNVSLTITSSCGSNSGSQAVTVTSAPTATTVSGSQSVCTGQTGVGYSVTAQTGVTYSWTVPTGATVTAGQGTNAITTTWSTSAVSGNVTCVLTNSCGSVTGTLSVSVGSSPLTPAITGNASVCPNQAGVVYSTTAQTGVSYSWTVPTGVTITAGQGTNSITTTWGASAVSGNVALTVTNTCGSANATRAVSVSSTPAAPVVSGPATVCRNATGQVYSTTAQSGVTYTWTVPTGVTITSGQGTNSITTTWGSTSVSGNVSLTITSSCGSNSGSQAVTVTSAPTATTVSGSQSVCTGQTGVGYSVTAQTGVTYAWTVPTGATITAGQGSNSITTTWSASAVSGNVTCVLTNSCGSVTGTLSVAVGSSPSTPSITGNASVCPNQAGVAYSTTAQTGVTYSWTVPAGVTITAGQGTNSITTTWGASAVSGNVALTVTNSCGSANATRAVSVSSTPAAPVVSGPATVCRNATGQVYSTTAQSGVTYTWTVPTGVTITAGQGTNSITTTWGSTSVSGNVSLTITSSCGSNSGLQAVTVTSAPTATTVSGSQSVCTGQTGVGYSVTAQTGVTYSWTVPTGATITAGQGSNSITTTWSASAVSGNVTCVLTNSCGSVTGTLSVAVGSSPSTPSITGNASVCPNQAGVVYSTTAQTGVTYSWTVPAGVTITSGQGTNSITTTWGASAVSGNVALTVTNACGSANATQAVSVSSTPAAPVVSGPASVCRNATGQVYSTTAQSGVTYTWTVPTGVTITSGQGTNSITTTWGASAVSGNVSLTITSSCGSNSGSRAVTLTSAPTATTVSGSQSVCTGQTGVGYSVTAQAGVTYSWTVPTGATITAGQSTNSITTSWSASAVSGNVTCVLTNSCGSVTGTLSVAVGSSPSTPSITGNASVCPNQTGVVYSTTAQTGVSYSWTVPSGVTITAGQGTNSITTTWGASAVSGNVALTVTNSCGSANATQAVTVSSTPAAPVVSGPATVCRNATGQVYSTTAQSGVTSYTWTVPTGVTITAGQGTNSITTTWGSTSVSGNVSLTITSSCGSNSGSLAVTIATVPTTPTVSGASSVCRGQTNVGFSVTAQTGVTYSWSVPAGVTINSGQGTASIVTTWGSTSASGNVTCTITNSCGSVSGSRAVTVNTAPTTPTVTGSVTVCANQSGVIYSVAAQTGVTYSWTVPSGVTITAGLGTNSITTTWGASAVSGNVSVTLGNSCGSSNGSLPVAVTSGLSIGSISGSASVVIPQTGLVYSVTAQSGVTFNWTVPAGVSITAGQGTNSITTSWGSSAVSGTVSVTGTNSCGSSTSNLAVSVSTGGTFVLESISGPTPICRPSTGVVYSVSPRPGVSYTWSVPSGVIITSGQGTNSITTDWVSPALSGNVSCFQSSSTGSGTATFFVTLRVSLPGSAGTLNGSPSACRGDSLRYFVRAISTADFYVWTPGAGMTINGSSGPVTTPDTAVYVRFTTTFAGDSLRVNTGNCKGLGTAPRSIFVSRTFVAPATPPAISGQNNALCGPSTFTYNIGSGVANALSYTWRTTIAGVLINGLPSPATVPQTATSVTVTFPAGFSTTGTLYVKANNTCGSSSERSLSLKAKPNPATAILGKDTVCRNTTEIYSVTPRQGVTTWTWTKPNSVTIVSGQGTSQVSLAFNNTTGSRAIKVTASNSCGSSTAFSKSVLAIACIRSDVSDVSSFNVDVYPNPGNDFFLLNFEAQADQQMNLQVFDLSGRLVYQQGVDVLSGLNSIRLDAVALQPGMYLVSLQGREGNAQVRIMVER